MTFRRVAGFNVAYILVVGWLRYFSPMPSTTLTRWVMTVALDCVVLSFLWYCLTRFRAVRAARGVRRATDSLAAKAKQALTLVARGSRRRPVSPVDEYFGRLIATEADRRGKSMVGFFDEGGHFVMREGDDEGIAALEAEHPPPELTDDLDNSWEPES